MYRKCPTTVDASTNTSTYDFLTDLQELYTDYADKRDAYWKHHKTFNTYNNWFSIPLIVITSFTGATALAQLSSDMAGLSYALTAFGLTSAIMTSLQKYLKFAERSENCKFVSKSYGSLALRIKNKINLTMSHTSSLTPHTFSHFVDQLHKETQNIFHNTDSFPKSVLTRDKSLDNTRQQINNVIDIHLAQNTSF